MRVRRLVRFRGNSPSELAEFAQVVHKTTGRTPTPVEESEGVFHFDVPLGVGPAVEVWSQITPIMAYMPAGIVGTVRMEIIKPPPVGDSIITTIAAKFVGKQMDHLNDTDREIVELLVRYDFLDVLADHRLSGSPRMIIHPV